MKISAHVHNAGQEHHVVVRTGEASQSLTIAAKAAGGGSNVNGGELLTLALATCYCNDIYREAARLQIPVERVEVEAEADFDGVGLPATNVRYRARVVSSAPEAEIKALLEHTDRVAEIQNTLRGGVGVTLCPWTTKEP